MRPTTNFGSHCTIGSAYAPTLFCNDGQAANFPLHHGLERGRRLNEDKTALRSAVHSPAQEDSGCGCGQQHLGNQLFRSLLAKRPQEPLHDSSAAYCRTAQGSFRLIGRGWRARSAAAPRRANLRSWRHADRAWTAFAPAGRSSVSAAGPLRQTQTEDRHHQVALTAVIILVRKINQKTPPRATLTNYRARTAQRCAAISGGRSS